VIEEAKFGIVGLLLVALLGLEFVDVEFIGLGITLL